jgi:hypothetical protein
MHFDCCKKYNCRINLLHCISIIYKGETIEWTKEQTMTYKTLYWKLDSAAQTPLKTRCSGRESSFCSTYITCRVTLAKYLVISHEGMRTGLWLLETEYIRGHQCHSYSITVNQVIYFSFDLIISGLSISVFSIMFCRSLFVLLSTLLSPLCRLCLLISGDCIQHKIINL